LSFTTFFFSCFFSFFCSAGVLTQGLILARQVLYHLSHTQSPTWSFYFIKLFICILLEVIQSFIHVLFNSFDHPYNLSFEFFITIELLTFGGVILFCFFIFIVLLNWNLHNQSQVIDLTSVLITFFEVVSMFRQDCVVARLRNSFLPLE
jgi:hypothetical protein